jgi:hypothetical protein
MGRPDEALFTPSAEGAGRALMHKPAEALRRHEHQDHTVERRDLSPEGRARRAAFGRSLQTLRELGFEESAVEFYRQAARTTGLLPHEVVRDLAEGAARSLTVLHRALQRADRTSRRLRDTPRRRRSRAVAAAPMRSDGGRRRATVRGWLLPTS